MSIYNQPLPQDSPPYPAADDSIEQPTENETAEKKTARGCGSCLGGCAAVALLLIGLAVGGGLVVWRQLPDWTHAALAEIVEDSDLPEDEKRAVILELDRVRREYKAGDLGARQLAQAVEQLAESPVFPLVWVRAAEESYVKPSGLSAEEKEAARKTFQRVARGLFEKQIEFAGLDPALDYVSTKGYDGQRQFCETVADSDLREMLA